MKVFICICASNRPKLLDETLYSLKKLKKPQDILLNIFIIDNNIRSNNKRVIRKYEKNQFYKIFYEYELKKGIVYARNKFLKSIKHICKVNDYVGFIDDDCKVEKNWLITHLEYMKKNNIDISTGPQIASRISKKKKIYYELTNKRLIENYRYTNWAATNNVIVKYSVLRKLNLRFDKNLNNIGGSDQLFFSLINKYGHKIIWNNQAIVIENLSPKDINMTWFFKRNLRYGYSGVYIYKKVHGNLKGLILTLFKIAYLFIESVYLILFVGSDKKKLKMISNYIKIFGILKFFLGSKIKRYN